MEYARPIAMPVGVGTAWLFHGMDWARKLKNFGFLLPTVRFTFGEAINFAASTN
jgi:hypothetical protein